MGDRPEKCLEMSGVVDNHCRGCFKSLICVGVYCCSEGTKLLIKFVLEVLHGLSEEFSVTSGLGLMALFIAWILSAIASLTGACARRIAVLLGSVPSMFPRCGMKSMLLPSMYVDLCSHSVYTTALRHWMWHHPACLSVLEWLLLPKLTPIMLSAPKTCLIARVMED